MRIKFSDFVALAAAAALAGCAGAPYQGNLTGEYLAGRFAARVNAFEDAANAYADAAAVAPGAESIAGRAFAYHLAVGDMETASSFAAELAPLDDENGGGAGLTRLMLTAKAMKAGDYGKVKTELAKGGTAGFLEPAAFLMGVWAEAGVNGSEAALARLDHSGSDFVRAFVPMHQALLAEQAGREDEARGAYQTAVLSPVGGMEARIGYGAFLERSGDLDGARDFYGLIEGESGVARRAATAGLSRLDAGKKSQAFMNVSPAQASALAFYMIGEELLRQMVMQRAAAQKAGFATGDASFILPLSLDQLALYLDPDLDAARRRISSIFSLYEDYERSASELAKIEPSSVYFEQARIEQAGALTVLGRRDEAIQLLEKTIRRDRNAPEARLSLASLLASAGRHDEAVKELSELIHDLSDEPDEDAWRFFVARGASLLELDRWPEAEADLERAIEIAPENPTALNYLGYSWAERGVNLTEAFALIEKALSLQPGSGAITDSLGWAYYQLGKYEEAVSPLERAAAFEPADPTITDHLGDVYWQLGRKIEAQYQWSRALELDPDDELRAALEKKLDQGLPDKD